MAGADDRVVSMQFDNAVFEQRMAETLKSLDGLKKSLDFDASKRGLDDLAKTGQGFHMGSMAEGVEGISKKFLAMSTIGITALATITSKAVSAGVSIAKSLSLDLAMAGFHEYETKLGSIQTILANTARFGTKLPEVTQNLDALNTYADKTIYSFGDMTKNIGLFTNAGIKINDATSMIKGFSNAAAASGTNAEGAASAAYQLSQGLSAGKITLMDWKSLTNVGMGNKNMQLSLVDLADKMGTLNKAGTNAKDVQANFNGSLEKGWLSADVMSTYLKIMAGDMDDSKIKAMGFNDAQVKAFRDQQKTAEDAATKVRTLTQLVGTVKEAIGSGWAKSFEIVFGNFETATELFTRINNAVGGMVGKSADARNALLEGWDKLGGRKMLIEAFADAFKALGVVFNMIKMEFRTFFPAKTSADLMSITRAIADFAAWLMPTKDTLHKLSLIFDGLFSIIDIGWHVIKELFFVVAGLIGEFRGAGGGALDLAAKVGGLLLKLDEFLIVGGALHRFFLHIHGAINNVSDIVAKVTDFVKKLFVGMADTAPPEQAIDRISSRFESLRGVLDFLSNVFDRVRDILGRIWGYISTWFAELGRNIVAAMKPGDFDAAVDVLNVGLLGGIVLMLKKFLKGGMSLDMGGGIFSKVRDSLDQLSGTLKAMQAELKAKALMEIAIAIGVLTASVVILSLIDSAALTKAMVALVAGFTQLVVVMKMLDSIGSGVSGAVKIGLLAGAMILMSTAALVLAGAVAILGNMGTDTLAKGLGAVGVGLGLMVAAVLALEGNSVAVLAASAAMIAISTAMVILAGAVKIFATMSAGELAKGLIAVAAALGILVVAMMAMPVASTLAAGLAMIPLATGLVILAGAIKLFATMSWSEMLKGMVGLAASLVIIGAAMYGMPPTLPITAAGLILVALALNLMVPPIMMLGHMKMGDLAKGLGGLAAMMLILAIGVNAMSGAMGGALALIVVSGALMVLTKVLIALSALSWMDLVKGLVAIAAVLVVLGVSAAILQPLIPALLALGVAMTLVGLGFTLFGLGAYMVGKALQILAETGKIAVMVLIDSLEMILQAMPRFVAALVVSLIKSSGDILNAAQLMLKILTVLLIQILDTVIELAPKIAMALVAIITAALVLIRAKFPDVMQTMIDLLVTMLTAISNNMHRIVEAAVNLVVNFANALSNSAQRLVDAALNLLFSFLGAIANRAGDIAGAGVNLLLHFLAGMANNLFRIMDFAVQIIIAFTNHIGANFNRILSAGADLLINFVYGIANNVYRVAHAGVDIILAFLNAIGGEAVRLARGAADALTNFLNGLAQAIRDKAPEIRQAGINLASAIISGMTGGLSDKAGEVVDKLKGVVGGAIGGAKKLLGIGSPSKLFRQFGAWSMIGLAQGFDNDVAENNAVVQAERIVNAFSETLSKIPDTLEGLDASPVIRPVLDLTKVREAARGLGDLLPNASITPDVSYLQARTIATTAELERTPSEPAFAGPSEVKFEQNIYAPEALSTNDIYKNTRSQFALAKEELNI